MSENLRESKMREFVIGDIHGGYRGLVQVLERAGFDYENDKLISVGDVCDGWSQTAEAIEELLKIKNLVYIKGNHDEWTQRFLKGIMKIGLKMSSNNHIWYAQGGKATYHCYLDNYPDLVDKHVEFIEKALLYYVDDQNRIFLHAGFNPNVDLDKQYFMDVGQGTEGENAVFYWDRSFWGYVVDRFKIGGVGEVWENYKEIYIGHTPTTREFDNGNPVNIGNVWNMDTGAGYDGRISLMDINSKEVFQSDPIYQLYPDEMGRNGEFLAKKENI